MLRPAHDKDNGAWHDLNPYHFSALWGQTNICQELTCAGAVPGTGVTGHTT